MTLLLIANVWPEPKSSAAGAHMMQLIAAFTGADFRIHFACTAAQTDNSVDLNAMGIQTHSITMNDSEFDIFVSKLDPQIVMFDRFMTEEQFGWRVMERCPNALRILNTEDLHSLRKGRQQALKVNAEFSDSFLFNDLAKREIASIYRSDLSLIISEAEVKILIERFNVPEFILHYSPFMIDEVDKKSQSSLPGFNERQHFMTIGNFLHKPNLDVVHFLKDTVWPLIKEEIDDAELHIYGAYMPEKVKSLNNDREGFIVKGFADDVDVCMQSYRVCLAPLRFGAGLKGKIVDAMKNGTPCMMSSMAAEGLFGIGPLNGFIEDQQKEFASKAIDLYNNQDFWLACQQNGFTTIKNRFNKKVVIKKLIEAINLVRSDLSSHRLQNFMGRILEHHGMQSTKYMSRWIEAKNKN